MATKRKDNGCRPGKRTTWMVTPISLDRKEYRECEDDQQFDHPRNICRSSVWSRKGYTAFWMGGFRPSKNLYPCHCDLVAVTYHTGDNSRTRPKKHPCYMHDLQPIRRKIGSRIVAFWKCCHWLSSYRSPRHWCETLSDSTVEFPDSACVYMGVSWWSV
ncbi:hypothetical protein M426DRAFT_157234 [Hypoxylon sp. CI-4A]|nr:hypothetical protein M426DRAFT_157234 [Hypoxylon sp. CI-4A]